MAVQIKKTNSRSNEAESLWMYDARAPVCVSQCVYIPRRWRHQVAERAPLKRLRGKSSLLLALPMFCQPNSVTFIFRTQNIAACKQYYNTLSRSLMPKLKWIWCKKSTNKRPQLYAWYIHRNRGFCISFFPISFFHSLLDFLLYKWELANRCQSCANPLFSFR